MSPAPAASGFPSVLCVCRKIDVDTVFLEYNRLVHWTKVNQPLFLPASGYRYKYSGTDGLYCPGEFGRYWTRTLDTDNCANAYMLDFGGMTVESWDSRKCLYGYSVRAVRISQN